jgi:hypothetical protein
VRWPDVIGRPRLTVAIPLFGARPWIGRISKNIARIPPDVRIVLSDGAGTRTRQENLSACMAVIRESVFGCGTLPPAGART